MATRERESLETRYVELVVYVSMSGGAEIAFVTDDSSTENLVRNVIISTFPPLRGFRRLRPAKQHSDPG
jgi:hypothetical protein